MTEPASAAAGGVALYKIGALGLLSAALVAVVVMAMTLPRSAREFVVAMICTVAGSIGGGAFVIRWLGIGHWAADDVGALGLAAVVFMCGLPAWVLVRGWFAYTEAAKDRSLVDLAKELRSAVKGD